VSRHRAFGAAFSSVGGFPNLKRPRVLWVGVAEGAEAMAALAGDVEEALVPLGFAPETRGFHAHFTLARFPKPGPIGDLPAVDVPGDPFMVTDVHLFRSQLHPKGARYSVVATYTLPS
jgi:RNA 2',3'-cyclic 3'-phosphodiesterase